MKLEIGIRTHWTPDLRRGVKNFQQAPVERWSEGLAMTQHFLYVKTPFFHLPIAKWIIQCLIHFCPDTKGTPRVSRHSQTSNLPRAWRTRARAPRLKGPASELSRKKMGKDTLLCWEDSLYCSRFARFLLGRKKFEITSGMPLLNSVSMPKFRACVAFALVQTLTSVVEQKTPSCNVVFVGISLAESP